MRYQAILITSNGTTQHLPVRESISEARADADAEGADADAQIIRITPRGLADSREKNGAWVNLRPTKA